MPQKSLALQLRSELQTWLFVLPNFAQLLQGLEASFGLDIRQTRCPRPVREQEVASGPDPSQEAGFSSRQMHFLAAEEPAVAVQYRSAMLLRHPGCKAHQPHNYREAPEPSHQHSDWYNRAVHRAM